MRYSVFIFLCVFSLSFHCQITQLYTGTTVTIKHLSCIGNTVLIGGLSGNYLAKSHNQGSTLIPLSNPGNMANYSFFQRLDKDTIFLLSAGNTAQLYRSTDGGSNWTKRMDTSAFVPNSFGFFNSKEGIADYGFGGMQVRTMNGGAAWTSTTAPLDEYVVTKTYSDSMVMVGGTLGSYGGLFLSKDRGKTWPHSTPIGGTGGGVSDLCFLNKDTLFAVSYQNVNGNSYIVNSTNGGQSWQSFGAPLVYNTGITARKGNELYVLGADIQNKGIIARSSDLGKTWGQFTTGIDCKLMNLIFLNDSIALLSGTNGVLLRWNYNKSIFTGLKQYNEDNGKVIVFPNPFKSKFQIIGYKEGSTIKITNSLGQVMFSACNFSLNNNFDLEILQPGVYYLIIEKDQHFATTKIIKE